MLCAILVFDLSPGYAGHRTAAQRGWYIIPRCNQFGYKKGLVMVDTLVLNLEKFDIGSRHKLTIQPPAIQPGGVIVGDFNIQGVLAAKAWHNADKFNVTVKPAYGSPGKISAFVQTSLPRYQAANNTQAVGQQQAKEILQHLEHDLSEIGINSKVNAANISRLDLFRNAETKYSFDTYSPVLNLLEGKRMKSQEFGGQGFMYRNTKHEIVAYDKLKEMLHKDKKVNLDKYQDKNLLRFEYRLKSHDKVSDVVGFETAKELIDNYTGLDTIYSNSMKQNLFHYDGRNIEILQTKKLESIFQELKNLYPRSYVRRFETIAAMEGFKAYGSLTQIAAALEKVSGNRMAVSRFNSRIRQQKLFIEGLKDRNIDIATTPIHELYQELKYLVLAA
jgi:hypothetical protein